MKEKKIKHITSTPIKPRIQTERKLKLDDDDLEVEEKDNEKKWTHSIYNIINEF